MHEVQSRLYGPAALRATLSSNAPRGRARHLARHAWRIEFGAVRGPLPCLPDGALSPGLCSGSAASGDRVDAVCHAAAGVSSCRVCALGQQPLVTVLTRCALPLPGYLLADEKHSRCLTEKVYLPTIVSGRVLWHLGYTTEASAAALTQSYGAFQEAALAHEPSYRVRGALTDGFESTTKSMRTLFPTARLGLCLRHALNKLPKKLVAIASPVRKALCSQFHTLLCRARQRKGLRVFALGQRLRRFADHIA